MTAVKQDDLQASAIAEAAAWLAVLHGPNRTLEVERSFNRWLATDAHARAFEVATEIWEEASQLPRRAESPWDGKSSQRVLLRGRRLGVMGVAAALLIALIVGAALIFPAGRIATDVGEQRTLTLDDGSQLTLNSNSRIELRFTRHERRVLLESGEALFEVAKDAARPFVVRAGGKEVIAHGTQFVVRRDAEQFAVTLIEGRVEVRPAGDEMSQKPELPIAMLPGQRLTFHAREPGAAKLDRPPLNKVLAWERHEVAFDNVALATAASEMNRYGRKPIVIDAAGGAAVLPVTGLFRAGDSASFARAVAEAYHLSVMETDGAIRLTGARPDPQR